MITAQKLHEIINFDFDTGRMLWKFRPDHRAQWNGRYAGKEAFTGNSDGYKQGSIFGRLYLAHKVIYAAAYDEWPDLIDHINQDRADNRLCNLRAADKVINSHNSKIRSDNTSGVKGVSWFKRNQCWRAHLTIGGVQSHLGYFQSLDDAVAARARAFQSMEPK